MKVKRSLLKRIAWVILFGIISFFIFLYFKEEQNTYFKENQQIPLSFWTLATLLISSPVAFIIWIFRDQNATQQIENQRKDINLKEFQKIAEWVSGLHLIEDEVTEKSITKDDKQEVETTTKYTQQNKAQSLTTFSKRDGAVGLQIAAIHSLLPFFRGEHGESFRRPALNLLTSAWLSLQHKDLAILDTMDVLENPDEFDKQIEKIQQNAKSPIGVALTQVLLSDGGDNILAFPEVFPNLCLAGMDFHLPGLDKDVLSLFVKKEQDCSGINLVGCNLYSADLNKAKLNRAKLNKADLNKAELNGAELNWANLNGAKLNDVELNCTKLNCTKLNRANLNRAKLNSSELNGAELNQAELSRSDLRNSSFNNIDDLSDTKLDGSIIYINNLAEHNINNFKKQGLVILYPEDTPARHILIILKHKENFGNYTYMISSSIDLEKTRQENPNWEITIYEITMHEISEE